MVRKVAGLCSILDGFSANVEGRTSTASRTRIICGGSCQTYGQEESVGQGTIS